MYFISIFDPGRFIKMVLHKVFYKRCHMLYSHTCRHLFVVAVGEIAYLIDPDSYVSWSFYTGLPNQTG